MKLENNWKHKTLENLEKEVWKDAGPDDTLLVQRVTGLRKVPLDEWSIEDMRLVIGQQFSLDYLIPLALEMLRENLFAEGDKYEGDLLRNVLQVKAEFWRANMDHWLAVEKLIRGKEARMRELGFDAVKFYNAKPYGKCRN